MPPEFGRDVDRLCVLELSRELDAERGRATGRRCRARRRRQRPSARDGRRDRRRPRRLRAARLPPAPDLAAPPDRRDEAARGGDPARRAARTGRRRSARTASARRRGPRARRGARPLGALALRRRAVPLGPGQGRAHRAARRRRRRLGRLDARRGAAAGEDGKDRVELLGALRGEHAGAAARDALRRALVETLLHGNREQLVDTLDETLLGLRPAAGERRRRVAAVTISARSWHRHVTGSGGTFGRWTKQNGCSTASSGSGS